MSLPTRLRRNRRVPRALVPGVCSAATIALALIIIPSGPVAAQARPVTQLEEIIVTTRKREERLQDVPVSISAFTAKNIEQAGMQNVEDIARMTPGFTVAPLFGGDATTPVIRGLSTTIGEPNVGFFVDGVYQSSRAAMDAMLSGSIERVEVAKGPQSALYGRNTFGGAINFVTRRPTNEPEGQLEATFGSESRAEVKGTISGPLVEDRVFGRIAGSYFERGGYFTNELTGGDLDDRRTAVVAASLEADLSDTLNAIWRISFESTDDGDDALRALTNNARPASLAGGLLPPAFQLFEGTVPPLQDGFAVTPGFFKRDNLATSLALDWQAGDYQVTAITGYNDLQTRRDQDNDFQARSIRYLNSRIDLDEISQELRVSSPDDRRLRWMLGGYYYDLDVTTRNRDLRVGLGAAVPAFPPFTNIVSAGLINETHEQTENFAIFGELGYDLTGQLRAAFSGRYSWEEKRVRATDTNPLTLASGTFEDNSSFSNFTPRLSLDYHITDDAMIYASAARAVKAGGFNVVTVAGVIFDEERTYEPEKSWHYELGAKTGWLDNRLTLNAAGFYIRWTDQIVRAVGGSGALLNVNAGRTTSQGFEIEMLARPIEGLEISGGFAYTDSKYKDYFFASLIGLGFTPEEAQLAGTPLQFVSKHTANGAIQYRRPIGGGMEWFGRADASYQSRQSIVQPGGSYVGSRNIVNLRTGFEKDRYSVTFWVHNLCDEDAAVTGAFTANPASRYDTVAGMLGLGPVVGLAAFGAVVTSHEPRSWGVTARVRF